MLTKAILTGGVLSVLAGSIVYFGTEGADALESDARENVRVEETELAGAADVAVGEDRVEDTLTAELDVEDPPKETSKPKTKWLDQYLKKSKPKAEDKVETDVDVEIDADSTRAVPVETSKPKLRIKTRIENDGRDSAKGTYIVSKDARVETLDVEGLDLDALDLDGDIDVEVLKQQLGLTDEENVQIRVIQKKTRHNGSKSAHMKEQAPFDYDTVLAETKKLLVTDMRNQAYLEIVDHAVDRGDMMQAADIVDDLSTPELRDTARARIGTGLARRGDTKAAFAVLDELEIDELSAPIRLEIITALMATKQERKNFASQ